MPHIDDGTLHALLDGALHADAPEEAAAAEAHLEQCDDCRARLEEAAGLRDAASAILAAPSVTASAIPDFDEVVARHRSDPTAPPAGAGEPDPGTADRRRRLAWTRRAGWAATVVLALGTGYLIRDLAGPAELVTGKADVERQAALPAEEAEEAGEVGRGRAALEPSSAPSPAVDAQTPPRAAPGPAGGTEGPVAEMAPEEQEIAETTGQSVAADAGPAQTPSRSAAPTAKSALAEAATADGSAAVAGIGQGTRRWATATVEQVSAALGGPLYLLPRAELVEIYLGSEPGAPVALSIQRLSSGVPVRVVQRRPPERMAGAETETAPVRADDAGEPLAPGQKPLSLRAAGEGVSSAIAPSPAGGGPALPPPETAQVTVDGFVLELTGSLPADLLAILGTAARPVPE